MIMAPIAHIVFISFLLFPIASCTDCEAKLYASLAAKANKLVRPVHDEKEAVKVDLNAYLIALKQIDENKGFATVAMLIIMSWNDYRLNYNAADCNLTNMVVPSDEVWTPNIFLATGKGVNEIRIAPDPMYDVSIYPGSKVEFVSSTEIRLPLTKDCKGWIANFMFQPFNHDKSLIILTTSQTEVDTSQFNANQKFNIISNSLKAVDMVYTEIGDTYTWSVVQAKVGIQRKDN